MPEKNTRVTAPRPNIGQGGLRVGRMTKPHGLKGGIKLELYTDSPDLRFVPGAVFHLQVPTESQWYDKTVTLLELKWFNSRPVGFFQEITDRTAAESIARAILWIDEDAVAAGAEDDAWYDADLVGLQVREGQIVHGIVSSVEHFPAQDLLAVATAHGTVLVPLVHSIVAEVNIEQGFVTVTPPAGLFNEADAEVVHDPADASAVAAHNFPASAPDTAATGESGQPDAA